jgi:hypothetical protein
MAADAYQDQTPNSDLRSLDRLVGMWNVSGGAEGKVTYEWLEGGFFLLQRYDLKVEQHRVKGKGTFSRDGRTCAGAWVYPGGGGYESNMSRAK